MAFWAWLLIWLQPLEDKVVSELLAFGRVCPFYQWCSSDSEISRAGGPRMAGRKGDCCFGPVSVATEHWSWVWHVCGSGPINIFLST